MFKFLKDKLKKAVSKISDSIKKEEIKEEKEKKGFFKKVKEKVATKKIDKKKFNELFWDIEIILLENNVAVEIIEKIKEDLQKEIVEKPIKRDKILTTIKKTLKDSIKGLLDIKTIDIIKEINKKKPFVMCFIGINGSGKTTTIAKIANLLQKKGLKSVLVAGDTWRKAAIEQIEKWAKALNVPVIKHDYGSDPAAVAFDGIAMAKARSIDAVLIDTAGRQHSNVNLIDELKKIVRVANPDFKIFVGESIVGNDCVEQCRNFNEAVGIDGIILTKADVDEKGGAAISISYITKKPILYLGTGQELDNLESFSSEKIIQSLGLD